MKQIYMCFSKMSPLILKILIYNFGDVTLLHASGSDYVSFIYTCTILQYFSIRDLSKDFQEMDDQLPKGQHGKCNNCCAPMMDQDASSAFLFFNPSYRDSNERIRRATPRIQGGALCCHLELPAVSEGIMTTFQTAWRVFSMLCYPHKIYMYIVHCCANKYNTLDTIQ